ncbi:Flavonol synthase/flavanone 3-hydroxylase [Raphanus sativus]|nr:Flavonol synthase/flavanone 3-hydroxylase [Raphanus sativus]KAJ4878568.1 Flavonol synthase/flavanone 3-hydroxylase [Raphanus sativus]
MEVERDQTESSPTIPIVDLSNLDKELVARAVVKASQEWGVFQVVNHEIPKELIQSLKKVGTHFFELSSEAEKESVATPENSKDIQGYVTNIQKDVEDKVDRVDTLFHNLSPPSWVDYRYWPKDPPEYRQVNEEYAVYAKKLAEKILGWLSEGLGLEREALFNKGFGGGDKAVYTMKINYYPPCRQQANLVLGLHPHTDIHGLTILVPNEIPGLQVFKDDQWFDVEYNPSAIVFIIGDPILRMSNGKYKNVLHRTTLNKERQGCLGSMAMATRLPSLSPSLTGSTYTAGSITFVLTKR